MSRTTDILPDSDEPKTPGEVIIEDKDKIISDMKEIKNVLFNFTCDNPEIFRQEIDEIEDKDQLYELKNILASAKAILNQVRAFGDNELKGKKIEKTYARSIPTLMTEVFSSD